MRKARHSQGDHGRVPDGHPSWVPAGKSRTLRCIHKSFSTDQTSFLRDLGEQQNLGVDYDDDQILTSRCPFSWLSRSARRHFTCRPCPVGDDLTTSHITAHLQAYKAVSSIHAQDLELFQVRRRIQRFAAGALSQWLPRCRRFARCVPSRHPMLPGGEPWQIGSACITRPISMPIAADRRLCSSFTHRACAWSACGIYSRSRRGRLS